MSGRSLVRDAHGALRAPWRVLGFIALFAVAELAFGLLAAAVTPRRNAPDATSEILQCLAALSATWLALGWIDKKGWSYVWMGREAAQPRRIAEGALLGGLCILVPTLLLVAAGWMHFVARPDGPSLLLALRVALILVPAALFEELLMRGYLLAVLREWIGAIPALLLTSALFGLLHLGNDGATVQSLAIVAVAGIFLGAVVLIFRSIYAGWAAHFAWNFMMAALLHAPVSGENLGTPDFATVDAGPDWATGGPWGPEGGAGGMLGMLGGMTYLFARRRRRGEP